MTGDRHGVRVTLCRDPLEFSALAGRWDALHRRCPTATPFQSHAWLHSWWLSYGTPGRLRIVLAHRGDRLVGAAPLMLTHRPMPLLVPLGGAISDFSDILVDAERAPEAVIALERGLHRAAAHTVVELREVRPGAAAESLFEAWSGARGRLTDSTCLELPAEPVGALIGRMPGSRAQRTRAKLRRIDALGIECRAVPGHRVAEALGTLLRLHELQWRGRGVNPEHLRPRFHAHLVRSVRRMVPDGQARVREFLLDGEVVAADLALGSAGLTGGYLYGVHPRLRERKVDVSAMLLRELARQAADSGGGVLSLLRGEEGYKGHWGPEPVVNQRLLLARSSLEPLLRLRASQVAVRDRAARTVKARFPAARDWRDRLGGLPSAGLSVMGRR
ncbi:MULTISPECIES: GNAT family N-acetyltransferase [Streptomyces]|uniref:GNAT family N-acetyltransferase n=1 Tax=Streptomyces TaxID=1883 RepID=UPI00081AFDED|nr:MULTISPECIES: GNAT family N-acetyltransferase [unclassified Streptomyces]MYQ53063.1 GNAT family N-acetyltransferase [Streptomyces sp. SID4941]SCD96825.1 Acetyltransferase involved in cellulose biosynthesis, CelD/BcsL family [Streptomyces sp. PalvLS-984]SDC32204.1 Acetyltransferase involved in cellulose biosynthesis, CelD/BcsL family [Streptomyces sp. AmelKG-A3]